MSLLVVALLSLLWLGFFLPSLLEARRTSSPYASATTFQDSLRRLGEVPHPKSQEAATSPRRSARATVAARRRDTLAVLTAAVLAGALLAVGFGGWATWAVLPPTVALVGYVVLLRLDAVRRSARRSRSIVAAHTMAEPARLAPLPPADTVARPAPDEPAIVPSVRRRGAVSPSERMAG